MEIDTSKMSEGKAAALEIAEAGRDKLNKNFAGDLFFGEADFNKLYPYPTSTATKEGNTFLLKLRKIFEDVDSDAIDREGEIPDEVFKELAGIGAFSIKVPKEYKGLGLSQTDYAKASIITGSNDGNIAALLSAHQSIGVPQPLLMYGTEEQKKKFLPRFADGAVSAFALTEDGVGSDPAQMETVAEPTKDGKHFILNGTKLWCTNGVKANVIIVMAKTPDKNGKPQITAFIVEMNTPGVEVVSRCHFMGLKALYNGIIKFDNVKIPVENIVLAEGKGMKVALNTLNIGRLTLPAICIGLLKQNLKTCREWGSKRRQWGCAIGKHQAIADKIINMTMDLYATEAIVMLTCGMVDSKDREVRVESAMCKMWGTEQAWRATDDTMQIRAGRGYETVSSLKGRGEDPIPVERNFRDCRINLIFEGSSEIMRLILAREALDPHLKVAGKVLDTRLPFKVRAMAALKAGVFYARWYPKQWLPIYKKIPKGIHPSLKPKLKYVQKTSKKLARALFHAMLLGGSKLDKQQLLLGRLAEIGTELFVITASVLRCNEQLKGPSPKVQMVDLVDCIFERSKDKIASNFYRLDNNNDNRNYKVAKKILAKQYQCLETI